ncbi:polyubiquitin [Gadus morhua]|uniref:Interferon stimulated gene 15-3 n=1 Tax=Gadus morhua TaxID=8049 RepID=D1GFD0_GADMO|nr:polyubiquitin-like [Gadus morhua]XP_030220829.1 polyubiquitin-like [Gadus morhua]XP_030220830.1 polyubiquitin-like [Gadus morhua]ACZ02439.1 interferon stimulated gene 15-3 [Gadus morhua]
MDIKITLLGGESHSLTVNPGTTVGSLKHIILQSFKLSTDKLWFDKEGQKINLNDDSRSLSAYGVPAGANILMLLKNPMSEPTTIDIFLRTFEGKSRTYTIRPGETVAAFKLKVQQREGMAVDQQRLVYEGHQLDGESRTLESYNVSAGSTIYLNGRLRGGKDSGEDN